MWGLTEYFCYYFRTHILDFKWVSCSDTNVKHIHSLSIRWLGHPAGNPRLGVWGSSDKLRWFPPRCFHNRIISRDAFELLQTNSSTYIHTSGAVEDKSMRDNLRIQQTHLRNMRVNLDGSNAGPRCSESFFNLFLAATTGVWMSPYSGRMHTYVARGTSVNWLKLQWISKHLCKADQDSVLESLKNSWRYTQPDRKEYSSVSPKSWFFSFFIFQVKFEQLRFVFSTFIGLPWSLLHRKEWVV